MFQSVLVPLDGSPDSAAAVPVARMIASATHGTITLMRAPTHAGDDNRAALDYLNGVAEDLRSDHLTVEVVVRPGEPSREIVGVARLRGADLIVMSTHAPGRRAISSLSSVGNWVAAHTDTPVILVPPQSRAVTAIRTLLVPVDGSPGASVGLGAATALARACGARIELLQVVVPAPAGAVDPVWEAEALRTAQDYIASMAGHLRQDGHQANGQVALGNIVEQICHCAEATAADLIVMSTHAVRWPTDAMLNSVSHAVLQTGNRPVLLVQREAAAG